MPKAFLSYSRDSEASVHQVYEDLMSCGMDEVWWDKRLVGAQSWWDTILQHIRDADVVVCLIDVGMPESTAVRREYQYAIDLGKPLMPILLSDHVEISTLPIELAGKQYVDYRPKNINSLADLTNAISNLRYQEVLPNPLPPEPPIPISERDYLIEKINSTEPLTHDVQVKVLSRLRRLKRSGDSEERDFAQASLQQLRNRSELLASVADDMDATPIISVPKKRGGLVAFSVLAVVALLLGYLYPLAITNNVNDIDTVNNAHSTSSVSPLSGVDEHVVKVDESLSGPNALVLSVPIEAPSFVAENDAGSEARNEVIATPLSSVDSQSVAELVSTDELIVESSFPENALIVEVDDVADGATNSKENELIVVALNSEALPESKQSVGANADEAMAGNLELDWDVDFTVFEETRFELCGFEDFTVFTNNQSNASVIEIRSADRSIPGQPFRGLHKQVTNNELYEILSGCHILLSNETTSGVSRVRVRAKGAY